MIRTLRFMLFLSIIISSYQLGAQKMLLLEKYGDPTPQKIYLGTELEVKLKEEEGWRKAYLEDIIAEQKLMLLGNSYISTEQVEKIRFYRPFAENTGKSLFVFGSGWSLFALIGYTFDGNPDTSYKASDAAVTGTSWLSGWAISKLFKYKYFKTGERKRLRVVEGINTLPDANRLDIE